MLITIRNGKAELRNDNGSLVRTMGSSNVVSVSMNSNQELVDISFSGDQVAIRMSNGKTRVRKAANGVLVRTI